MNDEQFKAVLDFIRRNWNSGGNPVAELRTRDTAQREALARAETKLAEAVKLIRYAKDELRTGPSYGWEDRLAGKLGTFLAQAEQQEAQGAQAVDERDDQKSSDGWIEWGGNGTHAPFDEMLGADIRFRDGDEFSPSAVIGLRWSHSGKGRDIIAYRLHERAALATQPAAGEPVATVLSSRVGNDTSTIDKALPDGTKLFLAPPAAAQVAAGEPLTGKRLYGMYTGPSEYQHDKWHVVTDQHADWNRLADRLSAMMAAPPAAAHGDEYEIWSAAQLAPGEGIEDGAERIRVLIGNAAHGDEAVRKDAERYRWIAASVSEAEVGRSSEWHTDWRRAWKLPLLLSQNAIAATFTFDEAIDAAMRAQAGEGGVV